MSVWTVTAAVYRQWTVTAAVYRQWTVTAAVYRQVTLQQTVTFCLYSRAQNMTKPGEVTIFIAEQKNKYF